MHFKYMRLSQLEYMYDVQADLKAEMVMAAQPGDLVAHNSFMLHRAGVNNTATLQR